MAAALSNKRRGTLAWGRSRGGRQGRGGSCLGGAGSGGSCAGQGFRLYFYERSRQPRSCGNRTPGELDRWSHRAQVKTSAGRVPPSADRALEASGQNPESRGPQRGSAHRAAVCVLRIRGDCLGTVTWHCGGPEVQLV